MIASEYLFLIIGLLIGYIVKDFFPSFFKEKGKNLATKQDIAEITEKQEEVKAKFIEIANKQKNDLDIHFKKYELYTVKKHEYYAELYKNIELCIGRISDLRGIQRTIPLHTFNLEDIKKYMSDKSFIEADKEIILSQWEKDKKLAIRDIEFKLERMEYHEAKREYNTAYNFYLLHRLFFSEPVSLKANELLINIYALWGNYNPDWNLLYDEEELFEENEKLNDDIDRLRKELFELLQNELGVKDTNQ
ncbi:TPA: hypothetical protein ACQUHF_004970 [Bacillus paranthracis]|uniref:Chromosome segregation ATPase n=1 Tax=Bacillus cereus (strain Q1) TaxID=361100 RepID=B9J6H5_BACCQ|nr:MULTISPECIES: hypothetical protein [Bacillus cereus group]ACM15970.1 Chromosome segregation ATPase [Bacillus cereus Q1]MBY5229315.1 hypothetical protein [Bacillus paranthracis]MCY9249095.1 hypothetical protein [Bacillus paranthracis]MDR4159446.1 hypothetical protein [Bacillus paranthracis]MDR4416445.1 hypothetical protein [Bacillus paranthracis]